MTSESLYRYLDDNGSFQVKEPCGEGPLYFPLVNEQGLMSSITPDLGGDIKLDQHSFLTLPVVYEDLYLSRATRNFWLSFNDKKGTNAPWSVTGRSVWQRAASKEETTFMEAGLLWQRVTRVNKKRGIEASVLNFVPARAVGFEVMQVEIENISSRPLTFTATSAIPIYGRSADNLRDHRHVTSLLHRLSLERFGIRLCPTMTFNERGHLVNTTSYFVVGSDGSGRPPVGVFPTEVSFIGENGDLEQPKALTENSKPVRKITDADQGKEAIGALQFRAVTLKPGQRTTFTLLLGIEKESRTTVRPPRGAEVDAWLEETKLVWDKKISTIQFKTGDSDFNNWVRWVQTQPILRKLFGCSFLPDFDYGRGGRGWRDLWQDCLALLLQSPEDVRTDIVHNFGGVRVDGSNATIIGRKQVKGKWLPEFIADRNNITRTWMDHGAWPFLTTLLYLHQTGDHAMLLEEAPYFRDALTHRGKKVDPTWAAGPRATNRGTVLEHILVQPLVPFFNVGEHNIIRLEDADWNDGLDMAHQRGESVAFTNLYGGNLAALATLLETLGALAGWKEIVVAEEVGMLLDRLSARVDYGVAAEKQALLLSYFERAARGFSGEKTAVPLAGLISDLREKADWIKDFINRQEWIEESGQAWYNGYYDDAGRRVEGKVHGRVRVTLAGQVYPIMAGIADDDRVRSVVRAVNKHLWDAKLGGVRLNTDFGSIQPHLGRAFSFAYGEKENGAIFSHMAVMYANALYQRGFAADGYRVLQSLFTMAKNSGRSRIFPGLPEYFNNEGRGRYMYLTGSASWYVLTLLTQAFGVRGLHGDLLIAPKLAPEQFDKKGRASVLVRFAGAHVTVTYVNPRRVPYEKMKIKVVRVKEGNAPFQRLSDREVVIKRDVISKQKQWEIEVSLG